MNPKCFVANLSDKNSGNCQENIFNPFDFQHILNNNDSDPDINFFNNKSDVLDSPYSFWKKYLVK